MAQETLHDDPMAAEAMLEGVGDDLKQALEELRELARGLHPGRPYRPGTRAGPTVTRESLAVPGRRSPVFPRAGYPKQSKRPSTTS